MAGGGAPALAGLAAPSGRGATPGPTRPPVAVAAQAAGETISRAEIAPAPVAAGVPGATAASAAEQEPGAVGVAAPGQVMPSVRVARSPIGSAETIPPETTSRGKRGGNQRPAAGSAALPESGATMNG